MVRLLGFVLVAAAAGAVVEVVHPKGLRGALLSLLGGVPKDSVTVPPPAPAADPGAAPPLPAPVEFTTFGPGAARELTSADRDFDRGEFDGAFATYYACRILAANAGERERADRGVEKAALAWALVRGAPRVEGRAADLESQWQQKLAAVEASPGEKAWLDLARWAAGAGLRDHLPYVVGQTLDSAHPGGHVQATLEEVAKGAGSKAAWIAGGMSARGLGTGGVTPAGARTPAVPPTGVPPYGTKPGTDEPSGIGGVNSRGIPFGQFTSATREKLRRAIDLQAKGTTAYRQATPDSPNRATNRETAMKCLKEARDIYLAAQTEDSESQGLDERLQETMLMIAQLRKDEGIGGR